MQQNVWTILKILNWTKQYFSKKGVENPRLDAEVLLCAVLKCERIQLYTNFDKPLEPAELAAYREYVARRANREPVAYILGKKGFMNHDFKVTKDTLVPRPETELLVEKLLKICAGEDPCRILDIGCGSGAILLSLLDGLPAAEGMGVDISSGAVAVARENAESIGVTDRCQLFVSDLFAAVPEGSRFNVIVSNPPYIPTGDLAGLQKEVQMEPRQALDGGSDGLDFYRRILRNGTKYLEDDGLFAFEIGIGEAEAVSALCRQIGFNCVRVCRDYGHIERMIFAAKEGTDYGNKIMEIKSE
jgi:release factor glutamine methyltransferase